MNNIHDFTKVLSQNIYFGTEFKKSRKFLPLKFGAIQYHIARGLFSRGNFSCIGLFQLFEEEKFTSRQENLVINVFSKHLEGWITLSSESLI